MATGVQFNPAAWRTRASRPDPGLTLTLQRSDLVRLFQVAATLPLLKSGAVPDAITELMDIVGGALPHGWSADLGAEVAEAVRTEMARLKEGAVA